MQTAGPATAEPLPETRFGASERCDQTLPSWFPLVATGSTAQRVIYDKLVSQCRCEDRPGLDQGKARLAIVRSHQRKMSTRVRHADAIQERTQLDQSAHDLSPASTAAGY